MRAIVFCLAACLAAASAAAAPVKLRIAWVTTADAPLLMYGREGIAQHEGTTYTLDPIHFQGSPPMITALATGDVDLVGFGFSSLPFAVENAGMGDLRIIADLFQDGVPGHYSNEFLVLKDGPVRTIEDLKGRSAATNAAGSAIDMSLRAILRRHGLEPVRDVSIVEVAFPNMAAMLKDRKVDLIASTRTLTADPETRQYATALFTQDDAIGRSEMAFLAARTAKIAEDRVAIVDYLEDELRALRWYSDPANHDEAVQIFAKFNKLPAKLYQDWLFTGEDFYHDPEGRPDLDTLQANIETERSLGFIKAGIDVRRYADLSLVEEAAKRLH